MSSFLKVASKQVADVRSFLRESAGGNSIKYSAEKGARHVIYVPFTNVQAVDEETGENVLRKQICAISGCMHEWKTADGKFKSASCLKDIVRVSDEDPNIKLNDGTCPFCDRVAAAWDIYRYRKEKEEETCKLSGEQRKKHLETTSSTFNDERKQKDPRNYMYILVVKFRLDDKGNPTLDKDNLPEYDIKVMKLSASRVDKIQQQIINSGTLFEGSEIIFEYPNVDDRRLLVSQSTTTPVFPTNMLTVKYPGVLDRINDDVAKFEWEGLEKAFPEWNSMTVDEALKITNAQFEQWDKYTKELLVNPNAKYLEYVIEAPTTNPSLNGEQVAPSMPTIPTAPTMPTVPNIPTAPTVPTAPTGQQDGSAIPLTGNGLPAAPPVPNVAQTPNDVFAGASIPTAPTVNV